MAREHIDRANAFLFPPAGGELAPEKSLLVPVMPLGVKLVLRPSLKAAMRPPGQDARQLDDIALSVSSVRSGRVQLHQLARVVLVDGLRTAAPLARHIV